MKNLLLENRRSISEVIHAALAVCALAGAFVLRFEFELTTPDRRLLYQALPILLATKLVVFRAFQLRDLAWRYIGLPDLTRLASANVAAALASGIAIRLALGSAYPRSIYVLDLLLCLSLLGAARVAIRALLEMEHGAGRPAESKQVIIYGAGKAGITVLAEIRANPGMRYRVVGFLDDDPQKGNLRIHGVPVLGGRKELAALAARRRVEEVLMAMPAAPSREVADILARCHHAGVKVKKIPGLAELIEGQVLVGQLRDVKLDDLLGRRPVRLAEEEIRARIAGRAVLVTGAGGSIGSELCRQIARYGPRALVGLDHAETALFQIEQELAERAPGVDFFAEVGSIQNRQRLDEVFARHAPESVYHTAAYKHVPMMEAHLFEAVENNVFGTSNVARAAAEHGVEDFVLISSDKAVRPVNVMGASKRVAELVCLSREAATKYVAVRFGNVLGSNGSVIPLFQRQIAAGGPVRVTHPEMRRYFMTIPEAAQLVLQAAAMGRGGEIFVLDMGDPLRIVDLARNLVLLSGLRPDEDIKIEFSGVRPGEKLYEELSTLEENTVPTRHPQIRIFLGKGLPAEEMARHLERLEHLAERRDTAGVLLQLKEIVPEYNPSTYVLRQALSLSAAAGGPGMGVRVVAR